MVLSIFLFNRSTVQCMYMNIFAINCNRMIYNEFLDVIIQYIKYKNIHWGITLTELFPQMVFNQTQLLLLQINY